MARNKSLPRAWKELAGHLDSMGRVNHDCLHAALKSAGIVMVASTDKKHFGQVTSTYSCPVEGCGGTRLRVRWNDGKRTVVCTKDRRFFLVN